jgi:hypothetical protein
MIELYFLIYRIPKMMRQLARERNRSALLWTLIAIGAWLGTEFAVGLGFGIIYVIASLSFGWSEEMPAGLTLVMYAVSLAAAILSLTIVRRILTSSGRIGETVPLPPAPPTFRDQVD